MGGCGTLGIGKAPTAGRRDPAAPQSHPQCWSLQGVLWQPPAPFEASAQPHREFHELVPDRPIGERLRRGQRLRAGACQGRVPRAGSMQFIDSERVETVIAQEIEQDQASLLAMGVDIAAMERPHETPPFQLQSLPKTLPKDSTKPIGSACHALSRQTCAAECDWLPLFAPFARVDR